MLLDRASYLKVHAIIDTNDRYIPNDNRCRPYQRTLLDWRSNEKKQKVVFEQEEDEAGWGTLQQRIFLVYGHPSNRRSF